MIWVGNVHDKKCSHGHQSVSEGDKRPWKKTTSIGGLEHNICIHEQNKSSDINQKLECNRWSKALFRDNVFERHAIKSYSQQYFFPIGVGIFSLNMLICLF